MTPIKYGRIYGRFSSKPQERGMSRTRQIDGAKEYAKQNNIEIVCDPYFDEAVSGKAGANLELEFGRLLKDAKKGECILVEFLDRLGRQNPFLLGKLIYDTVSKGIEIIAFKEGKIINGDNIEQLDTQFSLFTGAAVGHSENKRKMDRLRETTNKHIEMSLKGVQTGTMVKYLPQAYLWNEAAKRIEIDPDRAKVVQRIYNEYCNGSGKTTICKGLNADGIPTFNKAGKTTKGAKKWIEVCVKKILKNESYAGVLWLKGNKITCFKGIVPHSQFDKAQMLLKRFENRHGRTSNSRVNNLFAGIGACSECGGPISVAVSNPKRAGNKVCYSYRCQSRRVGSCAAKKMLNADKFESAFFAHYFCGSASNLVSSQSKDLNSSIEALQLKIEKLDAAIANLYDMAEEGDTTAKERIAQRKSEKFDVEKELNNVKSQAYEDSTLPALVKSFYVAFGQQENGEYGFHPSIKFFEELRDNNETRKKLVNILPSIFSKVIFDLSAKTLQAFTKKGDALVPVSIEDKYKTAILTF